MMKKIGITLDVPSVEYNKTITVTVKYKRLMFWGGARKKGDNSAFYFASRNVINDYSESKDTIIDNKAESAKYIIKTINEQEDNTIQSIDFFTHGSQIALYMVRDKNTKKNSLFDKDIEKNNVEENNLFASRTVKGFLSWLPGSDVDVINNIDFRKFTNSAKIEIHGCKSGADVPIVDNIAVNLSEYLYEKRKDKAVVIAHLTKANPNINGDKTTNAEQDYRHGVRIVFHNGKELFRTSKKGRITASEINAYWK